MQDVISLIGGCLCDVGSMIKFPVLVIQLFDTLVSLLLGKFCSGGLLMAGHVEEGQSKCKGWTVTMALYHVAI
jgi:hypothetical protein